jgi:CRISP-associated protein Cas1
MALIISIHIELQTSVSIKNLLLNLKGAREELLVRNIFSPVKIFTSNRFIMIKRTLYFGNPYYISGKLGQLVIVNKETEETKTLPVEDIGLVVFDHPQITLSQHAIQLLNKNNTATVFCNKNHLPDAMLFNLDGHQLQNERFRHQTEASAPLKKQLWQQTIKAKIRNQAAMLDYVSAYNGNKDPYSGDALRNMATKVKSGDMTGEEARAARYYWTKIFGKIFKRERYGAPPNPSLNYGYAILRAGVARALTGSGLLPTLGIHHHNKYNAYCLADDIMEPYRPFVDKIVFDQKQTIPDYHNMTKDRKAELLTLMNMDVKIGGLKRPLQIALSYSTSSLAACFAGDKKEIAYPIFTF